MTSSYKILVFNSKQWIGGINEIGMVYHLNIIIGTVDHVVLPQVFKNFIIHVIHAPVVAQSFSQGIINPLRFRQGEIAVHDGQQLGFVPGQLAAGILPVTPMVPVPTFPMPTPSLVSVKVKSG